MFYSKSQPGVGSHHPFASDQPIELQRDLHSGAGLGCVTFPSGSLQSHIFRSSPGVSIPEVYPPMEILLSHAGNSLAFFIVIHPT
jgi:hypothetical protein